MLFNSGNPNLLDHTRALAGDPATDSDGNAVPSQLWSDQDVKNFINAKYQLLRDRLRMKGLGRGVKRSYTDSVADQIFYAKPADFMRGLVVELEPDGGNLSTSAESDVSPIRLKARYGSESLAEYHQGNLGQDSPTRVFIHNEHIGIVPPPSTGGTKSIRLTYEAASSLLSGDTDEPVIPRPYHELICYKAAISLRETKNFPTEELRLSADRLEAQMLSALAEELEDVDYQIPAAGRIDHGLNTNMGSIKRNT